MPIYAYKCESCGHAKDVLQKMSDPVLTTCPSCGKNTFSKQVTAAGFQLKGSGWYVTDFRNGGGATAGKPESGGGTGAPATGASSGATPSAGDSPAAGGTASAPANADAASAGSASPSPAAAGGSSSSGSGA